MFYNENDPKSVEKYSSAISLSDMEMFIFPELIYALVLANMMSPKLWEWRQDPWFDKLDSLNEYQRLQRTKQFIMDRFVFNLDLDTWGLTDKNRELARFEGFVDHQILKKSNALFGYEGDTYYFDIDIRRHFGLDSYDSDIIPYWKTETIEAMDAFKYKEEYTTGAGECVSLSTLYAAALALIGNVPLEKIHLLATPLHSQNFIDVKDGIITNNRRVVTKNMWFNGTELSAKARRALANEKITLVVNNSGYVHTMYPEGTMPPEVYRHVVTKLSSFLKTDISYEIIASFLREKVKIQACFQVKTTRQGRDYFVEAEKVFHYEHASKSRLGTDSQKALMAEIDIDELYPHPLSNRIMLSELEEFFAKNPLAVDHEQTKTALKNQLCHCCLNVEEVIDDLLDFCHIRPELPHEEYRHVVQPLVELDFSQGREGLIAQLEAQRGQNPMVDLAFSAYRDLTRSPWLPFMKAVVERNPVVIEGCRRFDELQECYRAISNLENRSIYDEVYRVAQPDEVWNFNRGDGLEKALAFYAVALGRDGTSQFCYKDDLAVVRAIGKEFVFETEKRVASYDFGGPLN